MSLIAFDLQETNFNGHDVKLTYQALTMTLCHLWSSLNQSHPRSHQVRRWVIGVLSKDSTQLSLGFIKLVVVL